MVASVDMGFLKYLFLTMVLSLPRGNGILHPTSAAYKRSTNGQAGRVVQILKSTIKQTQLTNKDVSAIIAKDLLVY